MLNRWTACGGWILETCLIGAMAAKGNFAQSISLSAPLKPAKKRDRFWMGSFKTSGSEFAPLLYRFLLDKQRQNGREELLKQIEKALDQVDPKKVYRTGTTS